MSVLLDKFKEVLKVVSPVVVLVVILSFTLTPLPTPLLIRFLVGALAIVIGLAILLFGIELGITPFGNHLGTTFLKSNKLWFVIIVGFALGFFVNIAEPDLHVLAGQIDGVTNGYIPLFLCLVVVSIGTGAMLVLGIVRIIKKLPLNIVLIICYGVIAALALFSSADMLAIGFDSSGATTGALTVPLVLALAIGVAAMKRDSRSSEEDSFGLIGIMSVGAILGILLLNFFMRTEGITGILDSHVADTDSLLGPLVAEIPVVALESLIALIPMVVILFLFQKLSFKLQKRAFGKMLLGFVYTYVGLVIFLVGVHGGFMSVGNLIGQGLAQYDNKAVLVGFGFLIGMLVILTEPAVHILTQQIEEVTSGYIKRTTVLAALCIGVAVAVGLSMLRIAVPGIQLWHYILPGYALALGLTFFVPKLFVGIAFDSGGVASGPMTATFVLALAQGASNAIETSNILTDSFGVIAMVAMVPLIALQILGLIYKLKSKKEEV
ncbi:MAG: DUF1538 domain-containing protein [Coriobacteriia bacterium]|nr:DUF1538 domain-containing protein [Coriobacteriia bacterium]